jgi:hypothetical protein
MDRADFNVSVGGKGKLHERLSIGNFLDFRKAALRDWRHSLQ